VHRVVDDRRRRLASLVEQLVRTETKDPQDGGIQLLERPADALRELIIDGVAHPQRAGDELEQQGAVALVGQRGANARDRGAEITCDSSCGVSTAVPLSIACSVCTSSSAPLTASRDSIVVVVSFGPIGTCTLAIIAPASSAFTTRMIVTPVSGSPLMTARWM